jgi:hypothetical protein
MQGIVSMFDSPHESTLCSAEVTPTWAVGTPLAEWLNSCGLVQVISSYGCQNADVRARRYRPDSSVVEHFHGKEGVVSSILTRGSQHPSE